ncbi:MAG TPA: hypothetical protein PK770_05975, partial [Kiritimatiellia bacterium]|nr:hypothetical protein [Kiritimatiellia bacterium]
MTTGNTETAEHFANALNQYKLVSNPVNPVNPVLFFPDLNAPVFRKAGNGAQVGRFPRNRRGRLGEVSLPITSAFRRFHDQG